MNERRGDESAVQYWDLVSNIYDDLYVDRWSQLENDLIIRQLRLINCPPPEQILDLGCGTGTGLRLLSRVMAVRAYDGVDISAGMLNQFRPLPGLRSLIKGDMTDLSWAPGLTYDFVCSFFGTVSFADSLTNVVAAADRILRPSGFLMVSYYSRYSLRRLVRMKFEQVELFGTRMQAPSLFGAPPRATTYSLRQVKTILHYNKYEVLSVEGDNFFSGVIQQGLLPWSTGRAVSRIAPTFCHTVSVLARKEEA